MKALRERKADSAALERYNELACILTQRSNASAKDAIAWVKSLCQTLQIESLAHLGLSKAHLPAVAANAQISSSMQGNPILLTAEELLEILHKAL